jgi:hypothetical protein
MTPKEKAKQLYDKMKFETECNSQPSTVHGMCKKLALVCVNEIIETKPIEKDFEDHGHRGREVWYNDKTDYWLSVKHELSLL